jgi:hypothetical protein
LTFETEIGKQRQTQTKANNQSELEPTTQSKLEPTTQSKQPKMTSVALNINVHNFLHWTSIANRIDNPHLSRSQCMKNAMKELVSEKMLRSFIRTKYSEIKKQHPEYTRSECIKVAMKEWRKAE